MKKLLFALLIVLVASTVVQTEDKELEGIFEFIASLVGKLRDLYNMLVSNGHWNRIVKLVKERKIEMAFNVCSGYTGEYSACGDLVNGMAMA